MMLPFSPTGATVTLSATTSTGSAAIGAGSATASRTIRIAAPSTNSSIVFVEFGASGIEAATSNMPILPGSVEIFKVGASLTHVAGITASGTGTLYITPGEGI